MDARHGWGHWAFDIIFRSPSNRLRFFGWQRNRIARLLFIILVVSSLLAGFAELETDLLVAQPIQRRMAPRVATNANSPLITENFEIYAPDPRIAQQVAQLAESYRQELAVEWLGYELPDWQQRCPIHVTFGPHAGGETSFAFVSNGVRSEPVEWNMKIYGPPERILDSVLPHEVTHTIFATHFGRPLPRWADEGACTTVEHESERTKNQQMLIEFLSAKPSRGIPFNRMFLMRDYPHDILPLYAQGYSLARFLMLNGDRRQFIKYVEAGLAAERPGQELAAWDRATQEFYGIQDLSELQVQWLGWVKQGCPIIAANKRDAIALDPSTNNSVAPQSIPAATLVSATSEPNPAHNSLEQSGAASWYHSQAQSVAQHRPPANSAAVGRVTDAQTINRLASSKIGYLPGSIAGYDVELWRQWSEPSLTTMKTTLGSEVPNKTTEQKNDPWQSSGATTRSSPANTLWR